MPTKPEIIVPDPATIIERSSGVLSIQWKELLRLRRVVVDTFKPEDIHDLRVASRRFRAALELYFPFAPKTLKTGLRKNVRELTRALGGLRNIDEARFFLLSHYKTDIPDNCMLAEKLSELRTTELKRIARTLADFGHAHLQQTVRDMLAELNQKSLGSKHGFSFLAYFSEVSISLYLPIHQLLTVAGAPEGCESRHTLRIAIKKWRYFLEIMTQVFNCDYMCTLELLKEYQSLLGRMNDLVEFGVLISNLDLTENEATHIKNILRIEGTRLLGSFKELVERKPLAYTFQI